LSGPVTKVFQTLGGTGDTKKTASSQGIPIDLA